VSETVNSEETDWSTNCARTSRGMAERISTNAENSWKPG